MVNASIQMSLRITLDVAKEMKCVGFDGLCDDLIDDVIDHVISYECDRNEKLDNRMRSQYIFESIR